MGKLNVENIKLKAIEQLLYSCDNDETMKALKNCEDNEFLYVYMYNYNWDNGFEIPEIVMGNSNCDLSTALLIFYCADGITYLENEHSETLLGKWKDFLDKLYSKIISGEYSESDIKFKVPLSKIQLYKLKKWLSNIEEIFIREVGTIDLEITL